MKSLRLILSLNLIFLGLILLTFAAPKADKETKKTTSVKGAGTTKSPKRPEADKPANIPVIIPDNTSTTDTIETHYTRPQKKTEIKMFRRVINFHKRPLIT